MQTGVQTVSTKKSDIPFLNVFSVRLKLPQNINKKARRLHAELCAEIESVDLV